MTSDTKSNLIRNENLYLPESLSQLLGYFLIFGFIAVWKTPQIFANPRFWAEEGAVFYHFCLSHSMSECLFKVNLGYYQFFLNIFVLMSSRLPVLYGPIVSSSAGLLLHLIIVYQLTIFARGYRLSHICTVLLVAAWALLPQTFEVWMSTTNAQWVIGVSMLLMLATPTFLLEDRRKMAMAWAAVCGLSGIPGVLLAPLFFVRALREKSRLMWLVTIVLGLCAIVQFVVLETHLVDATHSVGRSYVHTPRLLISPTLLQTIIAPLFSAKIASLMGAALRDPTLGWLAFFALLIAGFTVFILVLAMAWSGQTRSTALLIATAWLFVSLVQTFGALGNPLDLLSGWAGGRYFLFGSMCLCLMLALGTKAASRAVAVASAAMLGSIVLIGGVQAQLAIWPQSMRTGPSWRDQVEACPPSGTCHVMIWPTGWSLDITK